MHRTPNLGIAVIDSSDDVDSYPATDALAKVTLDAAVTFSQGTLAAIPSPGLAGRRYYATDKAIELFDTGTQWLPSGVPSPIGLTMQYAGTQDPTDVDGTARWLICDGRALSRTTYAKLFNVIATTYGIGNALTTFNIPDGRGRVLMAAGAGSGLTVRTLATTGGEENHVLSTGEIPAHTHTGTMGGTTGLESAAHSHSPSGAVSFVTDNGVATGKGIPLQGGGHASTGPTTTDGVSANHTHTISADTSNGTLTISNAGSGTGHNNMMPYVVLNHIIKAL